MHGTRGGIAAGALFVLPGLVCIMALSYVYAGWGHVGAVAALFFGLKAAVLAVVLQAVVRVGGRALQNRAMVGIAAAAFVAIFFARRAVPAHHPGGRAARLARHAGRVAAVPGRRRPRQGGRRSARRRATACSATASPRTPAPPPPRARRAASVWLLLWLVPVAALLVDAGSRTRRSAASPCSSARWRSSPSAAPMPCWPMSRSRRSSTTTGCGRARCWTGSAWPRPRRGR